MRCNNDSQWHKRKVQLVVSERYSRESPREIAYTNQAKRADNSVLLSQVLNGGFAIFISRTNFVPVHRAYLLEFVCRLADLSCEKSGPSRPTIFGNSLKSCQKPKRTLDIHVSARIKRGTQGPFQCDY